MKQRLFWIGASVGFALILIKICACAWNADVFTVQAVISSIDAFNPISAVSSVMILYCILAIVPIAFASLVGYIVMAGYTDIIHFSNLHKKTIQL